MADLLASIYKRLAEPATQKSSWDREAQQMVERIQSEAERNTLECFHRLRSAPDAESAATAARTGDFRQAVAISNRLASWQDFEHVTIDLIHSSQSVKDAKRWFLLAFEYKEQHPHAEVNWKPEGTIPVLFDIACFMESVVSNDGPFRADLLKKKVRELIEREAEAVSVGGDGKWSKPDGKRQWARVYGFSPRTLSRRIKDGTIRAKVFSDKSIAIHLDDLPKDK